MLLAPVSFVFVSSALSVSVSLPNDDSTAVGVDSPSLLGLLTVRELRELALLIAVVSDSVIESWLFEIRVVLRDGSELGGVVGRGKVIWMMAPPGTSVGTCVVVGSAMVTQSLAAGRVGMGRGVVGMVVVKTSGDVVNASVDVGTIVVVVISAGVDGGISVVVGTGAVVIVVEGVAVVN